MKKIIIGAVAGIGLVTSLFANECKKDEKSINCFVETMATIFHKQLPKPLGDGMTMVKASSSGNKLSVTTKSSLPLSGDSLSEAKLVMRKTFQVDFCDFRIMGDVISAGAVIENILIDNHGKFIHKTSVNSKMCRELFGEDWGVKR